MNTANKRIRNCRNFAAIALLAVPALASAASISGTVTDTGAAPIAALQLCLKQIDNTPLGCVLTDANGSYLFDTLADGSYLIETSSSFINSEDLPWIPEWNDGDLMTHFNSHLGVAPVIVAGANASGINFVLAQGHRVVGLVRDAALAPMPNFNVCVYRKSTNTGTFCANTDANGAYRTPPLANDLYVVETNAFDILQKNSAWISEYHNDARTALVPRTNVPGLALNGADLTVNFDISAGFHVTGLVETDGGVPLINAPVCVVLPTVNPGAAPTQTCVNTNASGEYRTHNVAANNYHLRTRLPGSLGHIDEYHQGSPALLSLLIGATPFGAPALNLVANQQIDFALAPGASLSGTLVHDAAPVPIGVGVCIYDVSDPTRARFSQFISCTQANNVTGGFQSVSLPPGNYVLRVPGGNGYYTTELPLRTLAGSSVTGIAIEMLKVPNFDRTIASLTPFPDPVLQTCFNTAAAGRTFVREVTTLFCPNAGITSAAGVEQLTGLGSLSFFGNNVPALDVTNMPALAFLRLDGGNPLTSIDLSGNPLLVSLWLSDTNIEALDLSANPLLAFLELNNLEFQSDVELQGLQLVTLAAAGLGIDEGEFGDLPMLENLNVANNLLTSINIDNLPHLKSLNVSGNPLSSAAYASLSAQQGVDGLAVTLPDATTISGTVTQAGGGAPIANLQICVKLPDNTLVQCVNTGANGHYESGHLPPGSYLVETNPGFINSANLPWIPKWNDGDLVTRFNSHLDASPVIVGSSDVTGINFQLSAGKRITGTVRDASSAPVAAINMCVYRSDNAVQQCFNTDGSGTYKSAPLPAGNYTVETNMFDIVQKNQSWVSEYHNGTVTAGVARSTIPPLVIDTVDLVQDFSIVAGFHFSGVVVTDGGLPLANAPVCTTVPLVPNTPNLTSCVNANASGEYRSHNFAAGSYHLRTQLPGSLGHIDEFHDGSFGLRSLTSAPTATLAANTQIDFSLAPGFGFSGTLMSDAVPVTGTTLQVCIQRMDPARALFSQFVSCSASNSGNGTFLTPSLPPGDYALRAISFNGFYPAVRELPTRTIAGSAVTGINIDMLKVPDFGALIADMEPMADPALNTCVNNAKTNRMFVRQITSLACTFSGINSAAGLEQLTGLVVLDLSGNNLATLDLTDMPALTNLTLSGNPLTALELSGNPFVLSLNARDTALTALDLTDKPWLTFLDLSDSELMPDLSGAPNLLSLTAADKNLLELDLGAVPKLEILDVSNNALTELDIDGLPQLSSLNVSGNPLTLASHTYLSSFNGSNGLVITLDAAPKAQIAGRVEDEQGNPIAGLGICYYKAADNAFITCAHTNAQGGYALTNVDPGEYRVATDLYQIDQLELSWIGEYHDNTPMSTFDSRIIAGTLNVGSSDVTGIDFTLAEGHRLRGTVLDILGAPIEDLSVCVFGPDNFGIGCYSTDVDGSYLSSPLPPGAYVVEINQYEIEQQQLSWLAEYHDGTLIAGNLRDDVEPLMLAEADLDEIDFALAPGYSISGVVRDTNANPIANLDMCVFKPDNSYIRCVRTNGNGAYRTVPLPVGSYLVNTNATSIRIENLPWIAQWNDGDLVTSFSSHLNVAPIVLATADVSGVNFQLAEGKRISGTVRDAGNAPVAGINMCVYRTDNGVQACFDTSASGVYQTPPLPPGNYTVETNMFDIVQKNQPWVSEYHNGTRTAGVGRGTIPPLAVSASAITADFSIAQGFHVYGTVASEGGAPLGNVPVCLLFPSAAPGVTAGLSCVNTNASGLYRSHNVAAGSYFLRTQLPGSAGHVDEYHNGSLTFGPLGASTPMVNITANAPVDFSLAPGFSFAGTFEHENAPLTGTAYSLCVFKADPAKAMFSSLLACRGASAATGDFQTQSFPPGNYFLRASGANGYYPAEVDLPVRTLAGSNVAGVSIDMLQVTNFDATIASMGTLADPALQACVDTAKSGRTLVRQISSLACTNAGITSTAGLEQLTGLTVLDLSGNAIPSLDLTDMPALSTLALNGNPITALDLSANPRLFSLSVKDTDLAGLDLANKPWLTVLDISAMGLLPDFSGAQNLLTLTATDKNLTELDLSAATRLAGLNVANNGLSALDIDGLTQLGSLDITGNPLSNAARSYFNGKQGVNGLLILMTEPEPEPDPGAGSGGGTGGGSGSGTGSGSGSGSGSGTTTPPSNEDIEDTLSDITLPDAGGTIDDETVDQINGVLDDLAELSTDVVEQLANGDLSNDAALDVLDTLGNALALSGTASTLGGAIDLGSVGTSLQALSGIVGALGSELDAAQREILADVTQNTLTALGNLVGGTQSSSTVGTLLQNVEGLLSANMGGDTALAADLLAAGVALTEQALASVLGDLAASNAVDASVLDLDDAAGARSFLRANRDLLAAVLDVVSIELSAASTQNSTAVAAELQSAGLDAEDAARLATQLSQFMDPASVSVELPGGGSLSALEAMNNSFGAGSDAITVNAAGTVVVQTEFYSFPVNVSRVSVVPPSIPNGVTVLPDGSAISVNNGIAMTVVPAARDAVGLVAALGAAVDVTLRSDGGIMMQEGGSIFSATFGFSDTGTGGVGNGSAITVNDPVGSDPTSANYFYTVSYPDGTVQKLAPFVADTSFLDSLAERGMDYSVSRSTGIITTGGARFRPDYFVEPVNADDLAFLEFAGDATGVAYRPGDVNNDGIRDFEIISASGVQVIYGLP